MGSLFAKPKIPAAATAPVVATPKPDDDAAMEEKRRKLRETSQYRGRQSTYLSNDFNTGYSNSKLGE